MTEPLDMTEELQKHEQILRDRKERYHRLFTSALGKEVFEDMKGRAFCYRSIFGPNGTPEHLIYAREGMRNFVLETEAWIKSVAQPKPPRSKKARSQTVESADG